MFGDFFIGQVNMVCALLGVHDEEELGCWMSFCFQSSASSKKQEVKEIEVRHVVEKNIYFSDVGNIAFLNQNAAF